MPSYGARAYSLPLHFVAAIHRVWCKLSRDWYCSWNGLRFFHNLMPCNFMVQDRPAHQACNFILFFFFTCVSSYCFFFFPFIRMDLLIRHVTLFSVFFWALFCVLCFMLCISFVFLISSVCYYLYVSSFLFFRFIVVSYLCIFYVYFNYFQWYSLDVSVPFFIFLILV